MPSEIEFRQKLAASLVAAGHEVYFHEGLWENKFSVKNSRNYIDLYVKTNPLWEHHSAFPVLGIETKIAKNLDWTRAAIEQLERYIDDEIAVYVIEGKAQTKPAHFLIATDDAVNTGFVYRWRLPQLTTEQMRQGGWITLTEFYDRLLWDARGSVLRNGYFYSNRQGGAARRYDLWNPYQRP